LHGWNCGSRVAEREQFLANSYITNVLLELEEDFEA
jgi:hypothetical protein